MRVRGRHLPTNHLWTIRVRRGRTKNRKVGHKVDHRFVNPNKLPVHITILRFYGAAGED